MIQVSAQYRVSPCADVQPVYLTANINDTLSNRALFQENSCHGEQ